MNRNLYSKPDLQAFRQALSLSSELCKVKRQVTNHFNDKGRPDSKEQIEFIELSVIPTGDYTISKSDHGHWSAESFKVSYVYPDYLRLEDVIEHPLYGELKVASIEDMREYGVSTAVAYRINSIREIRNSGEWL